MNPANRILLLVTSLALSAGWPASAQTGAQANGQAAAQTTVPADKTHAQASGGASASSSSGASQRWDSIICCYIFGRELWEVHHSH